MIHIKDSLLPMGKLWSLDSLGDRFLSIGGPFSTKPWLWEKGYTRRSRLLCFLGLCGQRITFRCQVFEKRISWTMRVHGIFVYLNTGLYKIKININQTQVHISYMHYYGLTVRNMEGRLFMTFWVLTCWIYSISIHVESLESGTNIPSLNPNS